MLCFFIPLAGLVELASYEAMSDRQWVRDSPPCPYCESVDTLRVRRSALERLLHLFSSARKWECNVCSLTFWGKRVTQTAVKKTEP
jgi:hypothetical protein